MNYNVGERVKPKRHWPVKPLLFTVVVIALLVIAYYVAIGHAPWHHAAPPPVPTAE